MLNKAFFLLALRGSRWEDHHGIRGQPRPGAQTEKSWRRWGWRDDHGKRLREVGTEHSVHSFRTKQQEHTVEQRDMKWKRDIINASSEDVATKGYEIEEKHH